MSVHLYVRETIMSVHLYKSKRETIIIAHFYIMGKQT